MKGRERSMAIRSGINKQGWEKSDFPVACQKCYGQNPYMRMLKQDYGQECRICFRPFTVFKWKGDRGIYKRTCVCQACSKQKNVCQVCTLDLQFGLPMQVRDKRCGKNGKLLLDQNFVTSQSSRIKPPPPPGPPPPLKQAGSDKQLVFIPEKDSDQEGQGKNENKQNGQEDQYIQQGVFDYQDQDPQQEGNAQQEEEDDDDDDDDYVQVINQNKDEDKQQQKQ